MILRIPLLAVAAAAFALPSFAFAQESPIYELRGGLLAHDVDLWAAGSVEKGASVNGEVVFTPSFDLLGGKVRPAVGASVVTRSNRTSYIYADVKWEWAGPTWFFGLGLGAAVHNGELNYERDRKDLGSRVLFHIPAEIGVQFTDRNRISLYFEHVSNGYTADPNPGMDNIGVRLSHRF